MKDYYKTLGVDKNASQEDIKKAYRKLAHQYHPDKNGSGDETKFKEINEAYQTLGKPDKRKQYDQFGSSAGGGNAGGGFDYSNFGGGNPFGGFSQNGFDFGGSSQGSRQAGGWDFEDLGDIFGSFFGGGRSQGRQRGNDLQTTVEVDFKDVVFGVEKSLKLNKVIKCDRCQGSGGEPNSKSTKCDTCNGSGRVSRVQNTMFGAFKSESVCSDCRGKGSKYEKKCSKCKGDGVVEGEENLKVKIPAGIKDGQSIRLAGKGEYTGDGLPGDLYINVRVRKDKDFDRQGDDIYSVKHITLKQAILGDKVDINTVDGTVKLKIPTGTQSHKQFKLSGRGVGHLHSRGRGDHIVKVIVDIPKSLNRKQKKVIEELT